MHLLLAGVSLAIRRWVQELVIGEGLCPFAKQSTMTFREVDSSDTFDVVRRESEVLLAQGDGWRTTLLALEDMPLRDFVDLWEACELPKECELLAFHPTRRDRNGSEAKQYAMRAPFPVIQLLRRRDLEEARQSRGRTKLEIRRAMLALLKRNEDILEDIGVPALEVMFTRWRNLSSSSS